MAAVLALLALIGACHALPLLRAAARAPGELRFARVGIDFKRATKDDFKRLRVGSLRPLAPQARTHGRTGAARCCSRRSRPTARRIRR